MPDGVRVGAARLALEPEDVHREEREVEPDEHQPEVQLAEPLVEHAAEDLRPPVVEAAEDREDQAAEQHVVEVRDDVVGVGLLRVGRDDRVRDAREAADGEHRDEAEREEHRRVAAAASRPTPCRAS